jgi:hypothetical protein
MIKPTIGLYPDAFITVNPEILTVDKFLGDVQNGRWQDKVLAVRAKKQQGGNIKTLKERLPLVTGSGVFKVRENASLEKHSGFIVVDLDANTVKGRVTEVKEMLSKDPLFYSLFISCSGTGVCGFVKINPKAHREAFNYLSEHLWITYGLNMDEKCKDVSRPRFVSYDPDLYFNADSQLSFGKPTPKKERPKVQKYHFADEDFQRIITDIETKELDLTENYQDWIYCGFALVDQFDESGREYFHNISMYNAGYDPEKCDEKYDHLIKSKTGDITIDWFYYVVEKNGLKAYGKATNDFLNEQLAQERAFEAGLIDERPLAAVNLANIKIESLDVGMQIRGFLHAGYKIQKNEMTGAIEVNGEVLDDELLNTIYFLCRSKIEHINSRDIVYQMMDSRFTPKIHPFKDFMKGYIENPPEQAYGHIEALIKSLDITSENSELFIKKWLVSIIGSMYGKHSPLMLVLIGPQNCGKTEFFRRLLPELLHNYYAESKLDEGKDDMILMSKKIIILDDEMSGKSKGEEKKMKSTLSRQQMDLRVPFGRTASSLQRIAVMCGTDNLDEILNDPSGNRRLLPVSIKKVDTNAYNTIDKGLLFYELYLEYMAGYNFELTNEDIKLLNDSTQQFKQSIPEEELLAKYFLTPDSPTDKRIVERTASDICDYLKVRTRLHISNLTIGKYLKKMGFLQRHKKINKTTIRMYSVIEVNEDLLNEEDMI